MTGRKATPAQRRVWRHNSFHGTCIWAIKAFQGMSSSDTLTDEARHQVSKVLYELHKLKAALITRKDP